MHLGVLLFLVLMISGPNSSKPAIKGKNYQKLPFLVPKWPFSNNFGEESPNGVEIKI